MDYTTLNSQITDDYENELLTDNGKQIHNILNQQYYQFLTETHPERCRILID
jgi:hypothetical protein